MGCDSTGSVMVWDLVVPRVMEATSLRDADTVLRNIGRAPASYVKMKRTLELAAAGEDRDQVAT